jgi:hypothetical protein
MAAKANLTHRVEVGDHVVTRRFEEGLIFLDLESGCSFQLDDVGARMWELITEGSIERALEILAAEFLVSREVLKQDLLAVLDELITQNLARIVNG